MTTTNRLKPALLEKIQERGYAGIRDFAKKNNLNHSTIVKSMNGNSSPKREIVARWCQALNCNRDERIALFHAAGYQAPDELEEESIVAA